MQKFPVIARVYEMNHKRKSDRSEFVSLHRTRRHKTCDRSTRFSLMSSDLRLLSRKKRSKFFIEASREFSRVSHTHTHVVLRFKPNKTAINNFCTVIFLVF